MLTDEQVHAAATLLLRAERDRHLLEALPEEVQPSSVADGYRIQLAGHRVGERALGPWKVGATSEEAQHVLGVDGPFIGRPPAERLVNSGTTLSLDDWFVGAPAIEVEIGLVLTEDLDDVPEDHLELAEIVCVKPCIELVRSRFADMTLVGAPSLIADNAVASAIVAGQDLELAASDVRKLDELPVSLVINGDERAAATGAAALGHPLRVLQVAARIAASHGETIRGGALVITGTCTGLVFGEPGMRVEGRVGDGQAIVELLA